MVVSTENSRKCEKIKGNEEMILNLASKLSGTFAKKGYINSEDEEITEYGLFTLLSKILYFLVCISVGFFCRCVLESVVFYFSFLFVKKYAGGIHASTEQRCFVCSTISIICSICFIKLAVKDQIIGLIVLIIAFILTFFLCMYAPTVSKELDFDKEEIKSFSNKTKKRICFLWFVILLMIALKDFNIAYSLSIAIAFESILLIFGKVKNSKAKSVFISSEKNK